MTRFARADGSKSSNKRIPDEATPWSQLKTLQASDPPPENKPKLSKKIKWKMKDATSDNEQEVNDTKLTVTKQSPKKDNKEYKRRKPLTDYPPFSKDGKDVNVVRFEGFPVRKEDAERLKELKKKLLASKIPHSEIKSAMKLERRKAEKALSRDKKQVCFHCRQSGHMLSLCPNLQNDTSHNAESGICFKCGSTEHQHTQCKVIRGDSYKFATCFICKQEGHISKQCPDNPRGLYPDGGGCRSCGDVTHMKKDCPKLGKRKKEEFEFTLKTLDSRTLEALDDDFNKTEVSAQPKKKKKVVKM